MIRDTLRAILAVAVVAAIAAIGIETRRELATIDIAHRLAVSAPGTGWHPAAPQEPEPGRLRRLGRAAVSMADAALGVVR